MAQTQMQVAESAYQLRDTQKKLASTMLDNAEKDKKLKIRTTASTSIIRVS